MNLVVNPTGFTPWIPTPEPDPGVSAFGTLLGIAADPAAGRATLELQDFDPRAELVSWAAGRSVPDGHVMRAGGFSYRGKRGATAIPDMAGWIPDNIAYAEIWGYRDANTPAANTVAINRAFAYLASIGGGRLVFGKTNGSFEGPIEIKDSRIHVVGSGPEITKLTDTVGAVTSFFLSPRVITFADTHEYCQISDMTIGRSADVEPGHAIDTVWGKDHRFHNLKLTGPTLGVRQRAGQHNFWKDIRGLSPAGDLIPGSAMLTIEGALEADGITMRPAWTSFFERVSMDGPSRMAYNVLLKSADGIFIGDCYNSFGKVAMICINADASFINACTISSTYWDGVSFLSGVPYGIYQPPTSIKYCSVMFVGNFFGNYTSNAARFEGTKGKWLFPGNTFFGGYSEGNRDPVIYVDGTQQILQMAASNIYDCATGIKVVRAEAVTLAATVIGYANGAGNAAVELVTSVGMFTATGNIAEVTGGATDFIDTATGNRRLTGNASNLSVTVWNDDSVKISSAQTITGAKTFSSLIGGSISGNAATATALATPRAINGVSFDGSAAITLPTVNTTGTQTVAGDKTFSGATVLNGTGDFNGATTFSNTLLGDNAASKSGYGPGAGAAVIQLTSRSTGVTINRPNGMITLFSAAGSTTPGFFTVTNSCVTENDHVIITERPGATNNYFWKALPFNGGFTLKFWTAGGVSVDAPAISFKVESGVHHMIPHPTRMMYPHQPRLLTPAEDAAITAQGITLRYLDDMTPRPEIPGALHGQR